jgi:hypothetical protein
VTDYKRGIEILTLDERARRFARLRVLAPFAAMASGAAATQELVLEPTAGANMVLRDARLKHEAEVLSEATSLTRSQVSSGWCAVQAAIARCRMACLTTSALRGCLYDTANESKDAVTLLVGSDDDVSADPSLPPAFPDFASIAFTNNDDKSADSDGDSSANRVITTSSITANVAVTSEHVDVVPLEWKLANRAPYTFTPLGTDSALPSPVSVAARVVGNAPPPPTTIVVKNNSPAGKKKRRVVKKRGVSPQPMYNDVRYCHKFAKDGACAKGADCPFPHMTQAEAAKLSQQPAFDSNVAELPKKLSRPEMISP